MALSRDETVQRLTSSDLMDADEVAAFLANVPADQQPADGEQLARLLVKQNHLTKYQAEQIYAGKGATLVLGNYVILAGNGMPSTVARRFETTSIPSSATPRVGSALSVLRYPGRPPPTI